MDNTEVVNLTRENIVLLSVLATTGLVLMWGIFWFSVARAKERVMDILLSLSFLRWWPSWA